ncbi:MAG: AMP-binding protein [Rhodospirillales bacterium]|jgi:phenylacetate-CoA ligase|nr:AMP-binding protein [Rhodospirillales bacterium]
MADVVYYDRELECMSRPQLETHQLGKLRDQLHRVYEKSPLYRRKLDGAGIKPDDIQSMEDMHRLPFTEKKELQQSQLENPPWGDFGCITPEEAIRVFQTSGTTGEPVKIMLNRKDWFENFYQQFMHYRCGYGLTEKDILFVPFNYGLFIAWWGFQAAMEQAGLMIIPGGGQRTKDRLRSMIDWGATVVCGTPSYLLAMAETAAEMGIDLAGSPIRKLVAAGEPGAGIPATRQALEKSWGAELFDDIGATECGNFGHECIRHKGTHIVEGLFIAEIVDPVTLEPLPDGVRGEMVLTNLSSESSPLIRYRMRDLVKFDRGVCECGRTNLRLDGGVLGRTDDMFHFAGVNIYPSQIQEILHCIDALSLEYRLVVPRMGSGRHMKIVVEPAQADTKADQLEQACEELAEIVQTRIKVTPDIEAVEGGSLPRFEGKGKRVIRED